MERNQPLASRMALLAAIVLTPVFAFAQFGPPQRGESNVGGLVPGFPGNSAVMPDQSGATAAQDGWGEFERAKILARVGEDVILAGDVLGLVDQQLAPYKDKLPGSQYDQQRSLLTRRQLKSIIEMKILYQAFIRNIPPKKREEALANVWEQINQRFRDEQLPSVMKKAEVTSIKELDDQLQKYGWSIAKQTRLYGERQLGMYGVFQKIDRKPHVAHAELVRAYKDDIEQYHVPAKAKFEMLTVRHDRFKTEQDAYLAMTRMGREVVLGGAPFWAVAKRGSHGPNAEEGGKYDWTTRDSLASDVIDKTIFSIPVARMSQILRDDRGFHIVRVLERNDAHFVPFEEAQIAIRKKIQGVKREKAFEEYVARIQDEVPVWTIYDGTVTR